MNRGFSELLLLVILGVVIGVSAISGTVLWKPDFQSVHKISRQDIGQRIATTSSVSSRIASTNNPQVPIIFSQPEVEGVITSPYLVRGKILHSLNNLWTEEPHYYVIGLKTDNGDFITSELDLDRNTGNPYDDFSAPLIFVNDTPVKGKIFLAEVSTTTSTVISEMPVTIGQGQKGDIVSVDNNSRVYTIPLSLNEDSRLKKSLPIVQVYFQNIAYPYGYKQASSSIFMYADNPSGGLKIIGADPDTFRILLAVETGKNYTSTWESVNYSKDKNHAYYYGDKIEGADPDTFKVIDSGSTKDCGNEGYARDKNNVYYGAKKIAGADPDTFTPLGMGYSKDKNAVYWDTTRTTKDPKTFVVPGCGIGYSVYNSVRA